jgi:hypothetical protein
VKAFFRAYATKGYWLHSFLGRKAASDWLAGVGALWLLTEVAGFVKWDAPNKWLSEHWWVYAVFGLAWALWENRPRLSFACNLKDRDVTIEVRVGDIFAGESAFVVGCNTSFDTDVKSGLISEKSLQGQFTERYYDDPSHLDTDIAKSLAGIAPSGTNSVKHGKSAIYPVGTTAKVRARNRTAYLCAFATMNNSGNASASLDDLKLALPQLWEFIVNAGDHGSVAVPILGSGLSRIGTSREVLIREILRSFIAACSAQRPCAALTVVIHPVDYYAYGLDLAELGRFVTHLCKYTEFASMGAPGQGKAIASANGSAATNVVP